MQGGKLFTNSPSVAYLDSIHAGHLAYGTLGEDGSEGPVGDFYTFVWDSGNELCDEYNNQSLGGRTNWHLPTEDELGVELHDTHGNMFIARGWPTGRAPYWTENAAGSSAHFIVYLNTGSGNSSSDWSAEYVSCVSEP